MNPIEMLASMAKDSSNGISLPNQQNIIDTYFELFLDVSKDIHDEVFLKGNVLLNKLLPDTARGTKDLNFSCVNAEIYNSYIVPKLHEFGERLISLGLASEYTIREIQVGRSGGISVKNSTGKEVYCVDVSLHNESMLGVVEYTFSGSNVQGSSIPKILADKCLSTLSIKRFRRVKDFYDMYIILKSKMKFDVNEVFNLMVEKVGIDEVRELLVNYPFSPEIMTNANIAWSKLELTRAADGSIMNKPEFSDIITTVYYLYGELDVLLGGV